MNEKLKIDELDSLVPLFDHYMVFYGKNSNPDGYREYLHERIDKEEATVFLARTATGQPIGFVLNYHSFSSVSLGKIIVLNDLYVSPEARNKGIGEVLIKQTFGFAKECGAVRVDLGTAKDNVIAQGLYEKIGFVKDTKFYSYSYNLAPEA
ncbi:MAG: GNAT family N-acetyltransferase [Verrucomicrobia bacterium]|jgi:ribosomal protein S18 acetylase RimI-like enzyme|nr:GNAT family N-acetyltransferase [Verrucomicrobiota bacterium]